MTSGSQWSPGADSWVFRVEISLHFRGTHSVLQRVTGWWVCACIHTCTITHSHPYSHMQHTSTLSWTHTLTTHCCLSHTDTHTATVLPSLITGTHTNHPQSFTASPNFALGVTFHSGLTSAITLKGPCFSQIRPSNHTHKNTHTANWMLRLDRCEAAHCSTPAHI